MSSLIEYKNLLFKWFLENDKIILPDDERRLILISEYPEFELAALKTALLSYEDTNLVKKFEFKDGKVNKTGYILVQPLQNYEQNIAISGDLCYYISDTLNQARGENNESPSNSLSINSNDIESLLILIGGLLKERSDLGKSLD